MPSARILNHARYDTKNFKKSSNTPETLADHIFCTKEIHSLKFLLIIIIFYAFLFNAFSPFCMLVDISSTYIITILFLSNSFRLCMNEMI